MQHSFQPFFRFGIAFICFLKIQMLTLSAQSQGGISNSKISFPDTSVSIPFTWQGDSLADGWEPHVSILVPVKVPGCPKQFYMQFDTGSPYSMFYRNKLKEIRDRYPHSIPSASDNDTTVRNFDLQFQGATGRVFEIRIRKTEGNNIDWMNDSIPEIIGTLGVDLFDGKVVKIAYQHQLLVLSDRIDTSAYPGQFKNFIYAGGRILFPAILAQKRTILYFDTGSSMFELLTDKITFELLKRKDGAVIKSRMWSWDKYLTANMSVSDAGIEIAGSSMAIRRISYIENANEAQVQQMQRMGIGGMTGNKLFLGYDLIIDTKTKQFAILKPQK
ncbi:MAG: hypothetical protein ABW036_00270 [Flavitalea sp.]